MYFINDRERKYYRARIVRDMWGALSVDSDYGSLVTKGGRYFVRPVSSLAEANREIEVIAKVRKRHGYRVAVDPHTALLSGSWLSPDFVNSSKQISTPHGQPEST